MKQDSKGWNMGTARFFRQIGLATVLAGMLACPAWADPAITFTATADPVSEAAPAAPDYNEAAEVLVARLQTLENSYNPLLAQLYAPHAIIQLHRSQADEDTQRTEIIPGQQYKALLSQGMPIACAAAEQQEYRIISITPETTQRLLVVGERNDITRGVTKPIAWRISPSAGNASNWQIVQEIAEL